MSNDHRQLTPNSPIAPAWLAGLWQRQEIVLADGTMDRTTRVFWGQTHSLYVDIRIPPDRPSGEGRTSFADYSLTEIQRLADQKGFAGHVAVEGSLCRWTRYIDYRPNNGRPDEGRLQLNGDTLYEEGGQDSVLGSSYRETYTRICRPDRRSAALRRVVSSVRDRGGSDIRDGVLVIVDDRFLYARSRPVELPPAETLKDLLVTAGNDRPLIHAYLDCEISYGRIDGSAPWTVELSTVPFRENQRVAGTVRARPGPEMGSLELMGREGPEHWRIMESNLSESDLVALLNR